MRKTETPMDDRKFTIEEIPVRDLQVDPEIQRFALNLRKVERIKRNFNQAALGAATVSRRNRVTHILLDGWTRRQVVAELTDNDGTLLCHVFEDLTRAEEAQMFLDLNAGNQPNLLEKFRARIVTGDANAVGVNDITRSYGFTISPQNGNSYIQCVGAMERIYRRSVEHEAEPNYLQMALLIVTRAWGIDRFGTHAVMLEGLAALWAADSSLIDIDRLVSKLSTYPGGPAGLHTDATQMASLRRGHVSMAIAELTTDEYNKGLTKKKLPNWTRKRP